MRPPRATVLAAPALLAGLALAACAGSATGPTGTLTGVWGGTGVAFVAGAEGGTVEFDCAHGAFGPITADAGKFETSGTWAPEGGPSTGDERAVPAVYAGSAIAGRIVFTVQPQGQAAIGPFTARRGVAPELRKCF